MRHGGVLLLLAMSLSVGACTRPTAPADGLPGVDLARAFAPPPLASGALRQTLGDGSTALAALTVDPGQVFACHGRGNGIAKVQWRVKDPAVVDVHLMVGSRGNPAGRKMFAQGGREGEQATGPWVVPGTGFFLLDAASGKALAEYVVTGLPCR